MFDGRVRVGTPVWPVTVTVNVAVAVLPAVSVAVHVTVVAAIGNVEPDAGTHVTGTAPDTRSIAVGLVYVTAAPELLVAAVVMFDGTPLIAGGVVSTTLTVNEAAAIVPFESVAEQLTVVVPSANVDPEAGVHANVEIVAGGVAVADAV